MAKKYFGTDGIRGAPRIPSVPKYFFAIIDLLVL